MLEKTNTWKTDAVTKNLSIEDTISNLLKSAYKPYHLSSKSHTVKAIDRSNLEDLQKIEIFVNQQDVLEIINLALKSLFVCGKKALAQAGVEALLPLMTRDKSANLFHNICEKEGTSKRVFLYQERRFVKAGKAALSIHEIGGWRYKPVS